MDKPKIGIVGTGFIATGLARFLQHHQEFQISKVLTRRPIDSIGTLPIHFFTNSTKELIDCSDIIFECSGDAIHATNVILEVTSCNKDDSNALRIYQEIVSPRKEVQLHSFCFPLVIQASLSWQPPSSVFDMVPLII